MDDREIAESEERIAEEKVLYSLIFIVMCSVGLIVRILLG